MKKECLIILFFVVGAYNALGININQSFYIRFHELLGDTLSQGASNSLILNKINFGKHTISIEKSYSLTRLGYMLMKMDNKILYQVDYYYDSTSFLPIREYHLFNHNIFRIDYSFSNFNVLTNVTCYENKKKRVVATIINPQKERWLFIDKENPNGVEDSLIFNNNRIYHYGEKVPSLNFDSIVIINPLEIFFRKQLFVKNNRGKMYSNNFIVETKKGINEPHFFVYNELLIPENYKSLSTYIILHEMAGSTGVNSRINNYLIYEKIDPRHLLNILKCSNLFEFDKLIFFNY